MGERLLCKQEVIGSNPFTSTICGHQAVGIRRRLEKRFKGYRSGADARGGDVD